MRHLLPPLALVAIPALLLAQGALPPDAYEVENARSGYLYMEPPTRALQDDAFLNPGQFIVDQGERLWSTPMGDAGQSCASCHNDAATSMRGVAARYPVFDADAGQVVNLETEINTMLTDHMGAAPFAYETPELLGLTAYVSAQSFGMPIDVDISGPAQAAFESGRDYFYARRGQLDLSCAHCHEDNAGVKLRGDTLSQGQINGFPIYRLLWDDVGSRHRMFEWCNLSLRAAPEPAGSQAYQELELYLAWRGRGLPIETPAVRR